MPNKPSAVWLEVALNGPWGRDTQPGIPISPAEIIEEAIECAHEGASIIHLHAYDVATGRQRDDAELYARLIDGIRSKIDVIVYPTLPFVGSVDQRTALTAAERFAAVQSLAERGLLEWAVVDPGSTNVSRFDDTKSGKEGFVYSNPESHLCYGLNLARQYGFSPSYAIYEPGFMRLGAAWEKFYAGVPKAVYRFMFSDQFSFGFPPKEVCPRRLSRATRHRRAAGSLDDRRSGSDDRRPHSLCSEPRRTYPGRPGRRSPRHRQDECRPGPPSRRPDSRQWI